MESREDLIRENARLKVRLTNAVLDAEEQAEVSRLLWDEWCESQRLLAEAKGRD